MGNKIASAKDYGDVVITLEKKKYISGEQVNGYINISLTQDFPSNEIFLIVSGKEKAKIVTRKDNPEEHHEEEEIAEDLIEDLDEEEEEQDPEYDTWKQENKFYQHYFPVYTYDESNVFPAGQYSFPFSFVLKDDLPGSFVKKHYEQSIGPDHGHEKGPKSYGKIKYKLKAGLKSESLKITIYDKFKIIVDEKFDEGNRDIVGTPFDKEVQGYCYTSHGLYKVAAIATTNKFLVGDQATISFAVDASEASTDIKNVKAYLQMKTNLIAKGKTKELRDTIQSFDLGSIENGSKRVDENCMQVTFNIQTPEELQATTSGHLVKNNFFLKIKCEIDGCVCYSESPLVSFPVSIFNKHYGPQTLPDVHNMIPDWNPQTYDPYICEMDGNFQMNAEYRKNIRGFYNN